MKAIHNANQIAMIDAMVVANNAKIQFWKQFTTKDSETAVLVLLLLIMQRYNFESNSQQLPEFLSKESSCC